MDVKCMGCGYEFKSLIEPEGRKLGVTVPYITREEMLLLQEFGSALWQAASEAIRSDERVNACIRQVAAMGHKFAVEMAINPSLILRRRSARPKLFIRNGEMVSSLLNKKDRKFLKALKIGLEDGG